MSIIFRILLSLIPIDIGSCLKKKLRNQMAASQKLFLAGINPATTKTC